MLAFIVFFPVVAAIIVALLRDDKAKGYWAVISTGVTLLAMIYAATQLNGSTLTVPVCHLHFCLDGFRCIYGVIVCFMWFVSAMLSPEYFNHHHDLGRYYFFFLFCLGATAGVFLSADLYTTFMFFEMMSLGSYVWVAQEETDGALSAGRTYLTIAVLGGLVTLMGIFILYHLTGTLDMVQMKEACAAVENRGALWGGAVCLFFGFAAKAGVFPLHIWLPKAHPVAPAPASALLSGVLTKAGIFGAIFITAQVLPGEHAWGILLLVLAAITMVLGAVIAVFSNNLKHILACSSLSQIGFILTGVAMICLLGEENALAAHGSVLYMMNHSLVKLTLFLFAGVVYYSTHALDLNEIRGFGRNKPLLHVIYLCGACSLAGIPGFCGYLSKTLVHEAIVEYAHLSGSWAITMVEWLFLFSGGLTAAYLTKIYVAVFWQKGKETPAKWGTPLSVGALCLAAVSLPVIGLLPYRLADRLTDMTLAFTGGHPFPHAVAYFSLENLKGVAISLTIAALVYFLFIRKVLCRKEGEEVRYLALWPKWLDLEESGYKPFFSALIAVVGLLCRAVCDATDFLVLVCRRTFLQDTREKVNTNPFSAIVRTTAHRSGRSETEIADRASTARETMGRITNSLSFALMMTCLGLCVVLVFVILHVFG